MAWRALEDHVVPSPRRHRTPEHLAALAKLLYPQRPPEQVALDYGVVRDQREIDALGLLAHWPQPVLRALEVALDLDLVRHERSRIARQDQHLTTLSEDAQRQLYEDLLR